MRNTKRKAPAKSRPRKRRATMARSMPRPVTRQVHKFVRMYQALDLAGNVVHAPYQGALTTTLGQVANSSEFTNLYDQYMITYVKYFFYLEVDPSAQSAATAIYPKLYTARDQDDSVILSQNEMRERGNLKIYVLNPNRPVAIGYKPNVLTTQFFNGVTAGYTPVWSQWLDANNASVPHYGLKVNIDNFTNTNYRLRIEAKVWLAMRNSR